MIRYCNFEFEDYFINEDTGIITRKDGHIVETRKHGSYLVVKSEVGLTGAPIHSIQAHTKWGYIPTWNVHHKDRNTFNNALSNLIYVDKSTHIKIHRREDENKAFGDQRGKNNYMYGVKYKWINDGKVCKFLFDGDKLPDGWHYGRILSDEARFNISERAKENLMNPTIRAKISASRKGKKFTDEHKQHLSESLKASDKNKGKHHYNNGVISILARECPEGFVKGYLRRKQ